MFHIGHNMQQVGCLIGEEGQRVYFAFDRVHSTVSSDPLRIGATTEET